MKILASAENYLERILMLKEQQGVVRSIDIAHSMNFTKASVSIAMKQLRENGYVGVGEGGSIELTEKGYAIAARTWERHRVVTELLTSFGVPLNTAREDACRIEHDLSDESFRCIQAHLQGKKTKKTPS